MSRERDIIEGMVVSAFLMLCGIAMYLLPLALSGGALLLMAIVTLWEVNRKRK